MSITSKALWFIETHLDGDASLEAVAASAGVSRFHLSRAFAASTGSTLIARDIRIADPPQPREKAPTKLFFAASNLPAEEARLRSAGMQEIRRPWGATEWLDPEGNVFALSSR